MKLNRNDLKNWSLINLLFLLSILVFSCKEQDSKEVTYSSKTPYELVNPFIGTGGHGHTYPGATLPFGMVQLSPDTRLEGWDGCSGYHYTDSIIYGFSHTHLSGTGVSDYGDVLLMPTQKPFSKEEGYKTGNKYSSQFDKTSEKALPGYYAVGLTDYNIDVELTTTERVGIHKYVFNGLKEFSYVVLDLEHRDKLVDWSLKVSEKNEIEGHRVSNAWATEQHLYFVLQSSEPFTAGVYDYLNNNPNPIRSTIVFNTKEKKEVIIKVGVSAVSIEGARKNLEAEAPHWDFEQYKKDAKTKWDKALNKIKVKSNDEDKLEIFYSALYHTMIAPNVFSDVDGKYRGMDMKVHRSDDGPVYTVFSLWDTFRATHPLYSIIEQEKTNAFIRTFLKQYQDGGALPIWELAGNYTGCMIGYHAIPVIVDAYMKGLRDYDTGLAMEAMLHSARMDKLGLASYKQKGYIAAGDESESVSKTLEYAYDDWCIATMAESMNQQEVYNEFINRAQFYKNIFNPKNGFMQSKMNGGWSTGFNPAEVNFNFTEANSWQYSMFVPQDIAGLIDLHKGDDNFDKKLDELFATEMKLSGRHQVDITGLIGQYAHGNEPSHHMAYLYNYVGKPYKTQERVHQILTEQYTTEPDGLSGNEDCGQMSAWYVLSAMGFYSVTPGLNYYTIGTPLFNEATIQLENGKAFKITAHHVSDKNKYIQSASLNGEDLNTAVIYHHQITDGGELIFEMGPKPNKSWGNDNMPISSIKEAHQIIPVPHFASSKQTFVDSMDIELLSADKNAEIYYSLNKGAYIKYENPFTITSNTDVTIYAKKGDKKSYDVDATFKKIDGSRSITLLTEYDNQYNAGGDNALIDQLKGTANFRTGFWQGYFGKDVEVIVDLGKVKTINKIGVGALQDIKSWIFYPKSITLLGSDNGTGFDPIATIDNDFPDNEYGAFRKEFEYVPKTKTQYRYVKVLIKNYGKCPEWHLGSGNDTWLFLDEITVE